MALGFVCLYHPMYHVSAPFQFGATEKRKLQVPFNGQIEDVYVVPGNLVKKDQILLTMQTFDLQLQKNGSDSDARKAEEQYRKDSSDGKEAEADIDRQAVDQANFKAQFIQDQIDRGSVKAPFDGMVLSGDFVDQRNAVKKEGDELFVVAAGNGLRAELSVDERDIQDLHVGQHGRLATSALPAETFPFTIDRIVPLPETKESNNTFTVYAHLDEVSPSWKPGMAGEVRVDIERRSLIWIWTHKFVDYVKFKLWM
jgi:multidrug efflux pump subunit AcrA (membrane-fusion protein)